MNITHYGLDYAKIQINGSEFEVPLALAKAVEEEQKNTVTITFHIDDVLGLEPNSGDLKDALTDEEALEVLRNFERHHEGSMESMWVDLQYHADEVRAKRDDVKSNKETI